MWTDADDRPGYHFHWPRATLTEIEGEDWGEPTFDSGLVIRYHRLRKTPLRTWRLDDLRCMLGQQISLPALMPLALDVLESNPFAGEWAGNLIEFALKADRQFWLDHVALWQRMAAVVEQLESFNRDMQATLLPATARFRAVWHADS